jgi:hypothetical protein
MSATIGLGQESDSVQPVKVATVRTNKPNATPSRKPSLASPKAGSPVRLATSKSVSAPASQRTDNAVVPASCKTCQSGTVTLAPEELGTVYEEPMIGSHGSCGSACDTGCDTCAPSLCPQADCGTQLYINTGIFGKILSHAEVRVEGASFWGKEYRLPALVTTRRPANNPNTDGRLDQNDTVFLFGGNDVLGNVKNGIRSDIGIFFDDCRSHGILFRMFNASENDVVYEGGGTTEPVVMRPFFDTANSAQGTIAINYPQLTSGSVAASLTSHVYGGDALFRKLLGADPGCRLELLAGYQYARLDEDLILESNTTALAGGAAPAGTLSQLSDRFAASNEYHGFALGLNSLIRERRWSLNTMAKLSLGNLKRDIDIIGFSRITVPGTPPSINETANGLLARNTNNGSYQTERFIVSPEAAVSLGYRVTRNMDATVTYTYLGLPKVARVGQQLDPNLASNLSNPPSGAATPRFSMVTSNYSLHSLSYGLQWRF